MMLFARAEIGNGRAARCIILAIALCLGSAGQARAADYLGPPGLPAAEFPKPDRPVADIISPIWHSEKERDAADEPGQIVRLLGVKPGMTVADIGAGSGYLTVRLSPIVGQKGRVLAQDIEPTYLKGLVQRIKALKLKNVTVGVGEPHDPRLPKASVDLAILVHMYHEISDPYALLYNLAPALKSGGRVGIIDARKPTAMHGTPLPLLTCELAAAGYRQVAVHSLSGSDAYLAVFTPPAANARKRPADIKACTAE